ncbi:MAG TPA: BMP family ABC transporter substrate-binding protein [Candidatus Limnocylindrales bacterium]|nr:BMP family ABC transporter substrate-binding protein [Candidatus Limnocylindrales bacterium]
MRTRSIGLPLLAIVALVASACGSGTTPTASPAMSEEASQPAASAATTPGPSSSAFIGVVTDIGTLNDKNFNEYSFKGAVDGAMAIGAAYPAALVPSDQTAYAADIQGFVNQKANIIVTVGFNLTSATVQAAHDNPDIWFIGVDQSPICVTPEGLPDTNFQCKGDAKTLLPHYISLQFQEDQAGYLAGIVAAGVSKKAEIGAIGGTTLCAPCVRYIQGYTLGAQSVNPQIKVDVAYVTNDFSNAAFQDQAGGKVFAQNFLAHNPNVDVLFQVAGLTGNGVLDAACAANIYGIGVDVDQYLSYPAADPCLVTSAEKHLETAVSAAIQAIASNTATPGDNLYNAKNDGIGIADFHDKTALITSDIQSKIMAALSAMQAGTLATCPAQNCGVYTAP